MLRLALTTFLLTALQVSTASCIPVLFHQSVPVGAPLPEPATYSAPQLVYVQPGQLLARVEAHQGDHRTVHDFAFNRVSLRGEQVLLRDAAGMTGFVGLLGAGAPGFPAPARSVILTPPANVHVSGRSLSLVTEIDPFGINELVGLELTGEPIPAWHNLVREVEASYQDGALALKVLGYGCPTRLPPGATCLMIVESGASYRLAPALLNSGVIHAVAESGHLVPIATLLPDGGAGKVQFLPGVIPVRQGNRIALSVATAERI